MPRSEHGAGVTAGITANVTAILGPTNTGKTHRAVERMLSHASGIIGLPLRLLAREVYDRVTARVGEAAVALVTGEEKRIPARPRYWVCTVEAMPPTGAPAGGGSAGVSGAVDLLAVDEVQLASHPERGHVFTDRILHARGARETLLLGAETVRPLLKRLVPAAVVEGQPRFSTLTGMGSLALGALPPRTAVVAFSATRVFELGERLRARRGGAAIVLGALSPRARNAQVALYQAGEVDYLVATDAIGMGLNMDIDCVAFADVQKFDGRRVRPLENAELAQIAGRAGRHRRDGRFATLAPLAPLAPPVVRAIEQHRFAPEERLYWRSHDLDFDSVEALAASLRRPPPAPWLAAARTAEDQQALERLALRDDVAARADSPDRVALLWQICQLPDYRQLQLDDHLQLQAALFQHLTGPGPSNANANGNGRIPADWIARHVAPLETIDGDIETLLARMAGIRTWTYVAHQAGWVDDPAHWQERTRAAEDRLSDALHARLVQRFVDAGARRRSRAARTTTSATARTATPAASRGAAPASFAELLRAHVGATHGTAAGAARAERARRRGRRRRRARRSALGRRAGRRRARPVPTIRRRAHLVGRRASGAPGTRRRSAAPRGDDRRGASAGRRGAPAPRTPAARLDARSGQPAAGVAARGRRRVVGRGARHRLPAGAGTGDDPGGGRGGAAARARQRGSRGASRSRDSRGTPCRLRARPAGGRRDRGAGRAVQRAARSGQPAPAAAPGRSVGGDRGGAAAGDLRVDRIPRLRRARDPRRPGRRHRRAAAGRRAPARRGEPPRLSDRQRRLGARRLRRPRASGLGLESEVRGPRPESEPATAATAETECRSGRRRTAGRSAAPAP